MPLGIWQQDVSAATHRYVRPQENGNRLDTRWLALSPSAEEEAEAEVPSSSSSAAASRSDRTATAVQRVVSPTLVVPLLGSGGRLAADAGGAEGSVGGAVPSLSVQCHHFELDDFDSLPVPEGGGGGSGAPKKTIPVTRHGGDLVERRVTTLCIDAAHAGVGGIDSWGRYQGLLALLVQTYKY
jgi:hypothetical protein